MRRVKNEGGARLALLQVAAPLDDIPPMPLRPPPGAPVVDDALYQDPDTMRYWRITSRGVAEWGDDYLDANGSPWVYFSDGAWWWTPGCVAA